MTRQRTFIRTAIIEIVFFAYMHSLLSAGLYAFFADASPALLSLLLAIPYAGMFYVRRTHNFAVFAAAHVALAAWPLFLPAIWRPRFTVAEALAEAPFSSMLIGVPRENIAPLRVCWFIFLVFCLIRSVANRLRGRAKYDFGYFVFCIGLVTAISLFAGYFRMIPIVALSAVWAFALIASYLVYNQSIRVDESLEILQESGKRPVAAIVRFNNAILGVFLIPVALFAAISPWLPLGRAAGLLGSALLGALRALFRFISWIASFFPSSEPEMIEDSPPPPQPQAEMMLEEAAAKPAWMELLDTIIYTLLIILIVAGAAALLAYAAYRLYKKFMATRAYGEAEEEGGDTNEYIGPKLGAKPIAEAVGDLIKRFAPKTEAEKIRRQYYKKVRRHIRRGAQVGRSDTTGEIAAKIRPSENIDGLTALYDRARYNNGI